MARRSTATSFRCAIPWLSLALLLLLPALALAEADGRSEFTFFQGTQYPFTVIHLRGEAPGPTVLVQGGIQGDEICGAVTAQLLSRARVLSGNLIVVPRANILSIHLAKRAVNVDMNRRFDRDYNSYYEDRVARVIRFLLARCDGLVHLHEGSGFYRPVYRDALHGPKRYGQSIIIDAERHEGVDMGALVRDVLAELNPRVQPARYRFELFDTRTYENDSPYLEMRKSLTYYALTVLHIPALAVEVSKDIRDLAWKVRTQMEATILCLKRMGVVIEPPSVPDGEIEAVAAKAARVRINGRPLMAGGVIRLSPGATITAVPEHGETPGYSPALAVFASDRPGVNLLAAPRMALESFSDLELRVDGHPVAKARVSWQGDLPPAPQGAFVCWLNGSPVFVEKGGVLKAVAGDQLILEGVWGSRRREVLNLKGFVANPWANDGQDLGMEIILDPDSFMGKYRQRGAVPGVARFQVARETPGTGNDFFYVDIEPRQVQALRLKDARGQEMEVPFQAGSECRLPEGVYSLVGADSNGAADKLVATTDSGEALDGRPFRLGDAGLSLTIRQATTFQDMGTLTLRPGRWAEATPPNYPQ